MSNLSVAADAELARRRAPDQKGDQVAAGIEAALGERYQRARQRQPARHHDQRFQSLVERQLLHRRRHRHHLAGRAGKALAEIEPKHLVDALEPDIDERTVKRDRFGIEPASCGDRPAVRAQHRRSLDVGKPGHVAAPIDDPSGEPGPLVAERDEALAPAIEPQSRQPAKARKRRGQRQPAAILQRSKPHMRTVARIERGDRPGVDLDRHRGGGRELIRGKRLRRRLGGELRADDGRQRRERQLRLPSISGNGGGRWRSADSASWQLRGAPPGPRKARPDEKLRASLDSIFPIVVMDSGLAHCTRAPE